MAYNLESDDSETHERAWLSELVREYGSAKELAHALGVTQRHVHAMRQGARINEHICEGLALLADRTLHQILFTHPTDPALNITPSSEELVEPEPEPADSEPLGDGEVEDKPEKAPEGEQLELDRMFLALTRERQLYAREAEAFKDMEERVESGRPLTWRQRRWVLTACYRAKTDTEGG